MSKEEAFNVARKLVQEAVAVAHSVGIGPATVVQRRIWHARISSDTRLP
jgi:hypothetical protein